MPAEVEVKEVSACKKQLNIFVPPEDVTIAFEKSIKDVSSTISLPGFRKGKVPRNIIEKRYGAELESEVQGQLVSDEYHKVLDDNKWKALADPKIENLSFDRKDGFRFEATVEIYPEIVLKDYKKVKVDKPKVEVTDDEIKEAITSLQKERATLEETKGAAKEGDHLTVHAEYVVADEVVLKREHAHIHAGHNHLADLHVEALGKAMIGAKKGDEVDLEVDLDDNFPEEAHRGSKALLKMKVEEVKKEKLPKIDDDFLKPLQVKDEAELKERLTDTIKQQKQSMNDEAMCESILNTISSGMDIPIPDDLLKRQSANLLQQSDAVYRVMEVAEDEREKFIEEEIVKLKEPATIQVRNFFILDAVATKEKIFVTEREMAEHLYRMAMSQGRSPEELSNELRDNGGLAEVRMGLRERKTLKWLLDHAEVNEVAAVKEEKAKKPKKTKKKAKKEEAPKDEAPDEEAKEQEEK